MESKGTLKDVSMDWKTGRMRLTFELESDVSSSIDKMKRQAPADHCKSNGGRSGVRMQMRITGCFPRGWQRQWGYQAAGAQSHASEIRSESHDCRSDGVLVVPDTTEAEETALEAETFHIRPTSQVKQGKDGESIPYIYGACWIQYPRYKGNERVDKWAGSGMQGAGD